MQKIAHTAEKIKQRQTFQKALHDDRQQLISQHKQYLVKFEKNLLEKFQKEFEEKLKNSMANFQIELIENHVQFEMREKELLQQMENVRLEADKRLWYITNNMDDFY